MEDRAAITEATRELVADLLVVANSDREPVERLLLMTRRLASPSHTEGAALFAVVRDALGEGELAEDIFEASLREGYDALLGVIGEAQFRGQLRPLPPRFVISVLLGGVVVPQIVGYGSAEGTLQGVHEAPDGAERSALLAASIEVVCDGLLFDSERLSPDRHVH